VAIARAVVARPSIIFADEPTGNLDAATGATIVDLLFARKLAANSTLIIITHDPALAERCSRIVEMRDGRIVTDRPA
jgi:putative ABC transport system ATP-binding protein